MNRHEEILQSQCFQWHWNNYPKQRRMLFCVNNNSVNRIAGARMKAIGVVSGVSDMMLVSDEDVCFIELKVVRNGQSDNQKDFQVKVEAFGHRYEVVRTIDEFKTLILDIYG